MKFLVYIAALIIFGCFSTGISAQHAFSYQGQASAWANMNPGNDMPMWTGARYIPQINYDFDSGNTRSFGIEASANINGSTGLRLFDSLAYEGRIKPYRIWARYATNQLELRLGLQKINFGSASMLRPLMWFDKVDPRDPLQLTDGVWGLLGRYYFLSNANIWVWALYGNEGLKTWETGLTTRRTPEFGGRVQMPLNRGEAAFSYHHRSADQLVFPIPDFSSCISPVSFFESAVPENRYGLDLRLDVEVGLWMEAAWINKSRDVGIFTNQEIITLGADYTFGIGSGLNLVVEHLLLSYDIRAFAFDNKTHFSCTSLSYPISMFDNISAIVYYDWTNDNIYSFASWHHQFRRFGLYLMAFVNPETFDLPQQNDSSQLFSGKGFQLMLVYNH